MALGSVRLLSSAIRYALEGVDAVAPGSESLPTPCAGWDLRALMIHLNQSMDELRRAVAVEQADPEPANVAAGPAATFRSHARQLLESCIDGGAVGRSIAVGDQSVPSAWVVITAAAEVTVHGWDISVACGRPRSIPDPLALTLLSLLQLVVTDASRRPLFGPEVRVARRASPSDQLVAFLGRRPVLDRSGDESSVWR